MSVDQIGGAAWMALALVAFWLAYRRWQKERK